ncbi:hypothetical protein [Pararhizobium gei]|uniref:hypothetical protein n=1 Tax=Pararhizobium gei TaxID=1395951 RepID=UPI0023DACD5A|nr:hypothetical protein [Rhizobium gei]
MKIDLGSSTLKSERDAAVRALHAAVERAAKLETAMDTIMTGFRRVVMLRAANRKREAWELNLSLIESFEILTDLPASVSFRAILAGMKDEDHGR